MADPTERDDQHDDDIVEDELDEIEEEMGRPPEPPQAQGISADDLADAVRQAIHEVSGGLMDYMLERMRRMVLVTAVASLIVGLGVGLGGGYLVATKVVNYATSRATTIALGTTDPDGEHHPGVVEAAATQAANVMAPMMRQQMRAAGLEFLRDMELRVKSKEQRVGVSLNEFAKAAFGVYNPHYERLAGRTTDEVFYGFGDDLNWLPVAPVPASAAATAPAPDTRTTSQSKPAASAPRDWGKIGQ